jgi:hypothetical protein
LDVCSNEVLKENLGWSPCLGVEVMVALLGVGDNEFSFGHFKVHVGFLGVRA